MVALISTQSDTNQKLVACCCSYVGATSLDSTKNANPNPLPGFLGYQHATHAWTGVWCLLPLPLGPSRQSREGQKPKFRSLSSSGCGSGQGRNRMQGRLGVPKLDAGKSDAWTSLVFCWRLVEVLNGN